jgi:hypothetical protein
VRGFGVVIALGVLAGGMIAACVIGVLGLP